MPGHVQVLFGDQLTFVRMSGEIDFALAAELQDAAQDVIYRGARVRIDVSRVSFIDSIGIGFMARVAVASQAAGLQATMVGASRRIQESVALAGLVPLMDLQE